MEEPTETRPAGAEDLANGAREPEGPPPEVEEEEVEEEAKAALGSECKRRVELEPPSRSRPAPRREICAVVGTDPSIRPSVVGAGERVEMEETAAAAATTATAEKASSYRYWVREATGDAAPLPVPCKLDPTANGNGNGNPPPLGSVWNQVSHAPSRLVSSSPPVRLHVLDWRRNRVSSCIVTSLTTKKVTNL